MIFSYTWLKEYRKGELPKPDKLAELLEMHAFEVDEIRKQGKDALLDIAVLPNRADCLCHFGMAREISAITGKKLFPPRRFAPRASRGKLAPLKVYVRDVRLVPRYAALVIEGVRVQDSPKWLNERLAALGVNSINNIVDLTNYIMLEMGQPLHAFDYDTIQGHRMYVRQTKGGEKLETLDEQVLELPKDTLIIEDAEDLIDLAGIKGGRKSGISFETRNIVLQAANFDASTIYKTRALLKYRTAAADIYAHGIDPNLAMEALGRANQLLEEWGIGGKVVQVVDVYPKKRVPAPIRLNLAYAESLLGIPISSSRAKAMLRSLGCAVKEQRGNVWDVKPPTRRLDLHIPEDLIEEIGRIAGLEAIPEAPPVIPLSSPRKNPEIAWEHLTRDTLAGIGFTEVYNYSFIGKNDLSAFRYTQDQQSRLVELENPISVEFAYLRDSLLENLVKNTAANRKGQTPIRLFEIGKTFRKSKKGIEEKKMLGGVLLGENFYAAKGVGDFLLHGLGIPNVWYDDYRQTPEYTRATLWHAGKSAEIKVGSREIGFVGEISSSIISAAKIQETISAFHLNMEELARLASEEKAYRAPSRFPAMVRDIAILTPPATRVAHVMNAINAASGALVRDIDLFDMYEGGSVPNGKKNLAFHLVYQSGERTLTSKEVDELHNRIVKTIEKNPEWEVRK